MIDPLCFAAHLQSLRISFVTGVPDSLLKELCSVFAAKRDWTHVTAANEGGAIGLAIGHYLANGRLALVYMQNSGLGNAINPLVSLADSQVYGVPMMLLIGWRGELMDDGSQLHDEPQHVKQGQISRSQLDLLSIPYIVLDSASRDWQSAISNLVETSLSRSRPVAVLVRKNTFTESAKSSFDDPFIGREAAIKCIVGKLPYSCPVVATTGMASRELFEARISVKADGHSDFLTVGGMGHAVQIAAGIAISRPLTKVVCLDGDGSAVMHLGGLLTSANCSNLLHILLNNRAHDSVGGQPTPILDRDVLAIAKACGYRNCERAQSPDEISASIARMLNQTGSSFLEVLCSRGSRKNLGRPNRSPRQAMTDFMSFLDGM